METPTEVNIMLRTIEEKSERQQALRGRNQEQGDPDYLTFEDCAREMKVSRSTARRLFRHEPDVKIIRTPGSHRPIVRVPRAVFERVLRRSAIYRP